MSVVNRGHRQADHSSPAPAPRDCGRTRNARPRCTVADTRPHSRDRAEAERAGHALRPGTRQKPRSAPAMPTRRPAASDDSGIRTCVGRRHDAPATGGTAVSVPDRSFIVVPDKAADEAVIRSIRGRWQGCLRLPRPLRCGIFPPRPTSTLTNHPSLLVKLAPQSTEERFIFDVGGNATGLNGAGGVANRPRR